MVKTFRAALLSRLESPKDLRAIAQSSGVSFEQLRKMITRDGASTNVEDAIRIARSFGLTVDEFVENDVVEDRDRIAAIFASLTEGERRVVREIARGRDQEDFSK